MKELIVALSLLAPVPPADLAPPSMQLTYPLSWKTLGADGKVYTFSGTVTGTLTIEEPEPAPVGPTITALKNEAGQGVEQIRAGEVLVIEGVMLTKAGAQLRVQIPGHLATVLSQSPTRLSVRFPVVTAPVTGPLLVYHNSGSGWVEVTRGPRITLLPPAAPGEPRINGYQGTDPLSILGQGFGPVPGEVLVWHSGVEVVSWSDTRIQVRGAVLSPYWPGVIHLRLPGWEGTRWLTDWTMGPRGEAR